MPVDVEDLWLQVQVPFVKSLFVGCCYVNCIQICHFKWQSITRQATYREIFIKINSFTPCANRCDTTLVTINMSVHTICDRYNTQLNQTQITARSRTWYRIHCSKHKINCCVSSSRLVRKISPLLLTICAVTCNERVFMLIHVFYVKMFIYSNMAH